MATIAVSGTVCASFSMKMVLIRLLCAVVVSVLLIPDVQAAEVIEEWPAPVESGKPATRLVLGGDGNFYCFTNGLESDQFHMGEAVRVTSEGVVTVIHNFDYRVGSIPTGIMVGADGNIYGTTSDGGNSGAGTFFRITPNGDFKTVWSAENRSDDLEAGLVQGDDGSFFGVSPEGGGSKKGAVFRISPTGRRSVIMSFSDVKTQGAFPRTTLLKGSGGTLFGATEKGGAGKGGVIFEITMDGTFTALHSFDAKKFRTPELLLRGSDGALYGAVISSESWTKQVFRLDSGGEVRFWNLDHREVIAITEGADGNPYVTARRDWVRDAEDEEGDDYGSIYRLTSDGVATLVFKFNRSNGAMPLGLTPLTDGGFIGVTQEGGESDAGTVFRLSLSGEHTLLYSFRSLRGFSPGAALTRGPDGSLYGTMQKGGQFGHGTVFRVTSEGEVTVLHAFNGTDGSHPSATLLLASDGSLYGTTESGGLDDSGTIFRITPDAQFTSLYSFDWELTGASPAQALIPGSDGTLFGTTTSGGMNWSGTVYAFKPGGEPRIIADLPHEWLTEDGCLVMGADGNLYGLTTTDYDTGSGKTVFYRVTPGGEVKVLRSLSLSEGAYASGLTLGTDGNLYGTCRRGGDSKNSGAGTIFRITPAGQLTVLRSFSFFAFEGFEPSRLTLASDGNFYGAMSGGGNNGAGYVFKLTSSGEFSKIGSFAHPIAPGDLGALALTESPDGNLYGIARSGTIFRSLKTPRPNRAPYVNDDFYFIGATATQLPVLDNDLEFDWDTLQISGVTQGTGGIVQISDDKSSLSYKAGPSFTGEDRFTYEVSDGKGNSTTGNVVVRSWSRLNAAFSFALKRENGDVVGRLDLRMSGDGLFTGKAYLPGLVIPVRGKLDSSGNIALNRVFKNQYLSLGLFAVDLDAETFVPRFTGGLNVGSESFSFSGEPIALPGPLEGRYTMLFDVSHPQPSRPAIPAGTGWGAMSVKANGAVIAKGRLPDGTAFSAGGWFSDPESWTFSATAGRRSLAFGKITFADIPQESDANGTFTWITQATWRGPFALGFDTTQLNMVASRYTPQVRALPLSFSVQPSLAAVVIRGGDLSDEYSADVMFTPRGTASESGNSLSKFHVNRLGGTEGLWSGTFQHPDRPGQKRSFNGVVFQKTNRAEALFIDRNQSGSVELTPK